MDHLETMDDFVYGNWKLHGGICQQLQSPLEKLLHVFPKVEAAQHGSQEGIGALSMVNVLIHNFKCLLQHCTDYSKLYLAVIGNSLLTKFEKERSALVEHIKTLEELVVIELRSQLVEVRLELEAAVFSLDESEKQFGEELCKLIQKDSNAPSTSADGTIDEAELEAFYQVATKLGINNYRTAVVERRSLKRLLEQARTDQDKSKEKVVIQMLKLMEYYSKLYRPEGGTGSSCSSPRSGDVSQMKGAFEIESIATFNVREDHSGRIPAPPEEFRCPISLELMYDPVIISSGQTFERISIEKWFKAGYTTCPKTGEYLSHANLTPNCCVKRLIANWCEQNDVPVPANPPDSPDITQFQRVLTQKGVSVSDTNHEIFEIEQVEEVADKYKRWMQTLTLEERERWEEKKRAVLEIRYHLKDDEQARIYMAKNGFVDPLVRFLSEAIAEKNETSQEVGGLALYNLAVNNNRNKELILSAGIITLMDEMIDSTMKPTIEAAIALYLNLSCLNEARHLLVQTHMTSCLIKSINTNNPLSNICCLDAMHALFNLSTHGPNVPHLVNSGIISSLQPLVKATGTWADKAVSILAYLAQEPSGNNAIRMIPGLVRSLAALLDSEIPSEKEQAAACLWSLCSVDERCVQMVLKEGVIPALVMLSGTGTSRASVKAGQLLKLFRDTRSKALPGDQSVIQLDQLRLNEPEIKEVGTSQPQHGVRRIASANGTARSRSSRGSDATEVKESPKGFLRSRSRRFGRTMISLLKPCKHNSRKTK